VGVEGLTEMETDAILGFLYKHLLQDKYRYRHRWEAGMVLMWDNRCTMHFAEGGYDGHLRVMHRTTVAGDVPV
jgi:taurine dioxygenase